MVFCWCHQKTFFSSAIDFIFQILFPREDDCSLTGNELPSFDTVCETTFQQNPSHYDDNIFQTAFSAVNSVPSEHFDTDEASVTPTPYTASDTFVTDFYPERFNMAHRRQVCRKKEYLSTQKPVFSAVSTSREASTLSGILQSMKNWVSIFCRFAFTGFL